MTEKAVQRFDHTQLAQAISACGRGNFARAAGIGEKRLMRLLRGETEFRQEEIRRTAELLRLDAREIDAYFFTPEVQKTEHYFRRNHMLQLYKSNHFALTEIRRSGKKDTRGILCFEGLPSVYGSAQEITALESGVVVAAGRCQDPGSRDYRRGTIITVLGKNGVHITYGRLAHRMVRQGDYVEEGQVIGLQGSTGAGCGEYLTLEFRRNGRRVDGCEYLGIPPKTGEFNPPDCRPADVVTRACGLTDVMRVYIDCFEDADALWNKLYRQLADV